MKKFLISGVTELCIRVDERLQKAAKAKRDLTSDLRWPIKTAETVRGPNACELRRKHRIHANRIRLSLDRTLVLCLTS